jgi:hypothetical protein
MPSAGDICVSVAPAVSPPVFGLSLDDERLPDVAETGGETAGITKSSFLCWKRRFSHAAFGN